MTAKMGLVCAACQNIAFKEEDLFVRRSDGRSAGIRAVASGVFILVLGLFVGEKLGGVFAFPVDTWNAKMLALGGLGVVLIAWGLYGDRSRGRRRCPQCWYDMRAPVSMCSECGFTGKRPRDFYRPRRNRRAAALGAGITGLAAILGVLSIVFVHGWVYFAPTTVLIAGFTWLPDSYIAPGVGWPGTGISGGFVGDSSLYVRVTSTRSKVSNWQYAWAERKAWEVLLEARSAEEIKRATAFANYFDYRVIDTVNAYSPTEPDFASARPMHDYEPVAKMFEARLNSDDIAMLEAAVAMLESYGLREYLATHRDRLGKLVPRAKTLLAHANLPVSDMAFAILVNDADESPKHFEKVYDNDHIRTLLRSGDEEGLICKYVAGNHDAFNTILRWSKSNDSGRESAAISILSLLLARFDNAQYLAPEVQAALVSMVQSAGDGTAAMSAVIVLTIPINRDMAWDAVLQQAARPRGQPERFVQAITIALKDNASITPQIVRSTPQLASLLQDNRPEVRHAVLKLLLEYPIKDSELGPMAAALKGLAASSDAFDVASAGDILKKAKAKQLVDP